MPLKIFKNKYEHVHENRFFRTLAIELEKIYSFKDEHVVLIGNPSIIDEDGNTVAPDALFLSKKSFVIIDFKNYSGTITLPEKNNFEVENWLCGNSIIKGGNQKNPYIQLKNHKSKLADYLNYNKSKFLSKSSRFNTKYIDCLICFLGDVTIHGHIPDFDKNWFFIQDKSNVLGALEDITSTSLNINPHDLERLAHLFSTTPWNPKDATSLDEKEEEVTEDKAETYRLTKEQEKTFKELEDFLLSDENNILILSGPYASGKTFLINHLLNHVPKDSINGLQVIAPNNRIARNIRKQVESVSSLYSFIYKFSEEIEVELDEDIDNDDQSEQLNEDDSEIIDSKLIFTLRENNDSDKYLYIIDEAQHVSDAQFISPTIQFGSGQLLKDLIKYADFSNSGRKILLIGDRYRLGSSNYEESSLNPEYLKTQYELAIKSIEIQAALDRINNILKQAISVRNMIAIERFNQLELDEADNVKLVSKSDGSLSKNLQTCFKEELYQSKILAFSNDKIRESNKWIKEKVLQKGTELEKGDIVLINNNVIVAPDNPFVVPQKVFNGEFAEILKVSKEVLSIRQPIKKKLIELNFRELKIKLIERSLEVKVLSFENFWQSTEKEITREEYIAFQAYIGKKVRETINQEKENSEEWQEFTKSQQYRNLQNNIDQLKEKLEVGQPIITKLKEAEKNLRKAENNFWRTRRLEIHRDIAYHDKYTNSVHLRYGYALTVHKAQSYKWKNIFFNLDQGDNRGTENKQYFKWVYSGIGCALKKLFLINVPKITPYIKMQWRDNHACITNLNKTTDIFPFDIDAPIILAGEKPVHFNNTDEILFRFYSYLISELVPLKVSVKEVLHHNYAEHYIFSGGSGEKAKVIINYNGQHEFKTHRLANSTPKEFGEEIDKHLKSLKDGTILHNVISFNIGIVEDFFSLIKEEFEANSIEIANIAAKNYAASISVKQEKSFMTFDVFYNDEGFITTIYPLKGNSPDLYDTVKAIITDFITKHGRPLTEGEQLEEG